MDDLFVKNTFPFADVFKMIDLSLSYKKFHYFLVCPIEHNS
jgi:hypothetical protein